MERTAPIVVTDLTKIYGKQTAVDHVSFEVPWNRVTGFLGPNGAGKSTTLRMILGLTASSSGGATVLGRHYSELENPSTLVGGLLETEQFHPRRSAHNHLRIYAKAAGITDSRVREVLELVDLTDAATKKVGQFSLGMRQRLGLATALLGDPKILVLDEPANGLDPAGIRWMRSLLRSFAKEDRAVFLSSHLLGEIAQIADDVVVLDRGRLVAHSPVSDLLHRAGQVVKARTDSPERLRDALSGPDVVVHLAAHDLVHVKGLTAAEVGRAAAQVGIALSSLETDEPDLEQVFLDMTTEGKLR